MHYFPPWPSPSNLFGFSSQYPPPSIPFFFLFFFFFPSSVFFLCNIFSVAFAILLSFSLQPRKSFFRVTISPKHVEELHKWAEKYYHINWSAVMNKKKGNIRINSNIFYLLKKSTKVQILCCTPETIAVLCESRILNHYDFGNLTGYSNSPYIMNSTQHFTDR